MVEFDRYMAKMLHKFMNYENWDNIFKKILTFFFKQIKTINVKVVKVVKVGSV